LKLLIFYNIIWFVSTSSFFLGNVYGQRTFGSAPKAFSSSSFLSPPKNMWLTLQVCRSALQVFLSLDLVPLFFYSYLFYFNWFLKSIFFFNFILQFFSVSNLIFNLLIVFLIWDGFLIWFFFLNFTLHFFSFRFNAHLFLLFCFCFGTLFKLRFVFWFHPSTLNRLRIKFFNWTRFYDFTGCEFERLTIFYIIKFGLPVKKILN